MWCAAMSRPYVLTLGKYANRALFPMFKSENLGRIVKKLPRGSGHWTLLIMSKGSERRVARKWPIEQMEDQHVKVVKYIWDPKNIGACGTCPARERATT